MSLANQSARRDATFIRISSVTFFVSVAVAVLYLQREARARGVLDRGWGVEVSVCDVLCCKDVVCREWGDQFTVVDIWIC